MKHVALAKTIPAPLKVKGEAFKFLKLVTQRDNNRDREHRR